MKFPRFFNLFTDFEGKPWKAALARRTVHYLPKSSRDSWPKFPHGSLVYSWNTGLIGRIAIHVVGGAKYAHVGIILNNQVFESAVPKAQQLPIGRHEREGDVYEYFEPVQPFSDDEVAAMLKRAESMLGRSYTLRNYFKPWTQRTQGTWCSPFVAQVLNASGRYALTRLDWWEPQDMFERLKHAYRRIELDA